MKKQNNKNIGVGTFVFFLVAYFLLFITATYAQFELPTIGSIKPTIILNSNPLTPLPDSTITITANLSGITGAGGSNYVWFLNSVRQTGTSGLNKNTFAFKTGAIGAIYRVNINVTTPSADILFDAINLTVSDVDLTWTANSQAPAGYRGKIFPTKNSTITVSALPFIYRPGSKTLIGSGGLTFNWFINDKLKSDKSGTGKSDLSFRVDGFAGSNNEIRLEILTEDKTISLNKFITIPVVKPQIWLYFSDPKTNLPFGAALKNLTTKATNFNFVAQTYFFTAPAKNLKWQWFVNNTEVGGENEKPWLATLNLANDFLGAFSAQIKIAAQNPNDEMESSQSITNLEIK